jgi:ferredoxin
LSVPAMMNSKSIHTAANAIGVVFPVYYETYGGIPLIIERFVHKLVDIQKKYIFAICTYGSGSLITLNRLTRHFNSIGGELSARISVNMPENVAAARHNNPEIQKRMFDAWSRSLDDVCAFIKARKKGTFDTPNVMVGRFWSLAKVIGIPALLIAKKNTLAYLQKYSGSQSFAYDRLLPLMDNSFRTNDKCNGCRTCLRICPVANIEMSNNRPLWKHHCELCLACFHWCPTQAIDSTAFPNIPRYHHPDVFLSDMMNRE